MFGLINSQIFYDLLAALILFFIVYLFKFNVIRNKNKRILDENVSIIKSFYDWIDDYIRIFDNDSNSIILAYTNSQCLKINNNVRNKLFDNPKEKYLPKELIVFNNFYSKVSYPISLSRGAYWLGKTYEQIGDTENSIKWYQIASKYLTTYYGQLAFLKIYPNENFTLNDDMIVDNKTKE